MTFESFCKQVAQMVVREHVPVVIASVEATKRASEIIFRWENVDANALFGPEAIAAADDAVEFKADQRLLAGVIAYLTPMPDDFPGPSYPDGIAPPPLAVPCMAGPWFILAIRDPHMALDGLNLLLHGNIHGFDGDPNDGE